LHIATFSVMGDKAPALGLDVVPCGFVGRVEIGSGFGDYRDGSVEILFVRQYLL